jgi:hypothetical protein
MSFPQCRQGMGMLFPNWDSSGTVASSSNGPPLPSGGNSKVHLHFVKDLQGEPLVEKSHPSTRGVRPEFHRRQRPHFPVWVP